MLPNLNSTCPMYLPDPQPLQRALLIPSSATKMGLAGTCVLHDPPHPWSHPTASRGRRDTQQLASGMLWHRKLFSSKNNLGQMLILGDVDKKYEDQQAEKADSE